MSDNVNALSCRSASALLSVALFSFLFVPEHVLARTLIFQSSDHQIGDLDPANSPQVIANEAVSVSDPQVASQAQAAVSSNVMTSAQPVQSSSATSELFFMIEDLQMQIKSLRGVIEEQGNEIHHLKRNAKARYLDLDSRVQNLTKKISARPVVNEASAANTAPLPVKRPAEIGSKSMNQLSTADSNDSGALGAVRVTSSQEEKDFYQSAYALIKEKKFEESVARLHEFIDKFPDSPLAGNAYYWLGEVYLVLPKLEQARQAFSIVVQAYPEHSKVADSLFKLGVAYDRLQNAAESQKYLTEVQKRYPESTAAKLAKSYKINR